VDLAALANVVRPVQLATLARMAPMVNPARMELEVARARMPAGRKNCSQPQINAIALAIPAQLAPLDQRAPMDRPAMLAAEEATVKADRKDHPAQLDHQAQTANLVVLVHLALVVF